VWDAVQEKFRRRATLYPRQKGNGRLSGRAAGAGWSSLFSGVLRCGVCEGSLVVVSGNPHRGDRRYGCGFHREKGPQVCANGLTVKIDTIERTLLPAIRKRVLHPAAVRYLVDGVNTHLDGFRERAADERRRVEQQLEQVGAELANVEKAILAGITTATTATLLRDRETQRETLRQRLHDLDGQQLNGPLRIDEGVVEAQVAELDKLLDQDPEAANAFFRDHVEIRCVPVEEGGRRFYRASGETNGSEMLKSLGLAQAFDLGGCGGWI
jgi:site-specific DNA recombinase